MLKITAEQLDTILIRHSLSGNHRQSILAACQRESDKTSVHGPKGVRKRIRLYMLYNSHIKSFTTAEITKALGLIPTATYRNLYEMCKGDEVTKETVRLPGKCSPESHWTLTATGRAHAMRES